ncbi:adenosine deaminase [bacterium]|nr:MAG: adenosine deaminase [bacterium]
MTLPEFCRQMPKVELHVHLEGSIRPETVLKLAQRNGVELPADTVEGLRDWYTFRDFPHFVEVYVAVTKCIKTADDVETIMREFLEGQKAQNILHSEVTYTASTVEKYCGISWKDQHAALLRGIRYGEEELGVTCGLILDIVRGDPVERAMEVTEWATSEAVIALGLAGEEHLGTRQYAPCVALAAERGLPWIPHAGETTGPQTIRECLEIGTPRRIGHGVRSIEDLNLVADLRDRGIPLEVCPTSNVAVGGVPSLAEHPLPRLMDEGVAVTINSDDPPMFGTTLSDEFARCAETFDLDEDILYTLTMNAVNAALVSDARRAELRQAVREGFAELEDE